MGVHTGDSITVAPTQTLSDREFQLMRDASFAVIREIGVETGGSNIQFAVNPENGRMVVIEMNPRVSRSSALASKATGFPIAKIAAKLAVGYTLDEIRNDITRETPASFEPTIDYCVVKVPRFTFEKFPQADPTSDHADEKRRRSNGDRPHLQGSAAKSAPFARDQTLRTLRRRQRKTRRSRDAARAPHRAQCRTHFLRRAGVSGWHGARRSLRADQNRSLVPAQHPANRRGNGTLATTDLRRAKKLGFSDRQIAVARRNDAKRRCARNAKLRA